MTCRGEEPQSALNKYQFLYFPVLLLTGVLFLYEGCSEYEALNSDMLALSSPDVCSNNYQPVALKAISTTASKSIQEGPFAKKKWQVEEGSQQQKAGSSYLITLDTTCNSSNAVYQKALGEVIHEDLQEQTVKVQLSAEELSTLQETLEDEPCLTGISTPKTVRLTSLPRPETNDPRVSALTHLDSINYAHAFEHFVLQQSPLSQKVRVAFVDSGADCDHPDLSNNLNTNCGYDALSPTTLPNDTDGHGTHVTGMVSAEIDNAIGGYGIAGNLVEAYAIRVIANGSLGTSASTVANGINQAITAGADIINISMEASGPLPSVEQAISNAVQAGILVVVAAGNSGKELLQAFPSQEEQLTKTYVSPAFMGQSWQGIITVGSVDTNGTLSTFSNFGSNVELYAPGAVNSQNNSFFGVYSTSLNGGHERMLGTSQATPIVTGAAALLIHFLKQNGKSYSVGQIESILKASVDSGSGGLPRLNMSRLSRQAYDFAQVSLCP